MADILAPLPDSARARLDELKTSLIAILGDDLDALLLYGSLARGEYQPERSDVNLMVVLRDDAEEKLEAIGPTVQLAQFSARIGVMIVRSDEIPRAADCFPLLYEDIGRCGVVLHGRSPFEGLTIRGEHKRLRIEQELREVRIRLRRVVADNFATAAFGRSIARKVRQIREPLRALLELRGETVDDHLAEVIRASGRVYGLDAEPLFRALETPREAYEALVTLLERALKDVDELTVED